MSLSDLLTARSQVTIRTGIYTELEADGVTVRGLQSTSMLRALPEIMAQLEADAETARVTVTQGGYLSTAEVMSSPAWLYLLSEDFYQVIADPAVATEGIFRISATAAAGSSTISTGKLRVRYGTGATQRIYENTQGFTPVLGGYVDVPMRAQIAGAAGNIGNNATLALVTAYPGLSATNPPVGSTGTWITLRGSDVEIQASIATRCRDKWGTRSLMASRDGWIEFVRQAFADVGETSPITRVFADDTNPDGPGSMRLYLARDGVTATAQDVATVDAWMQPRWRAGGGPFATLAAPTLTITLNGTLTGPTNPTAAQTEMSAALDALAATYPIEGATIYAERVRTTLMNGITGAKNVVIDMPDTALPPGYIVDFVVGSWTVVGS